MDKTPTGWTDADGNPTYVEDQPARQKTYSIQTGDEGAVYKVAPSKYIKPDPTLAETIGAYYTQNNWLGSVIADKTRGVSNRWDGKWDFDTEMLKNPDLEPYKDKLFTAQNPIMFNAMAAQIRMEMADKDTIDRTEGFFSNAAGFASTIVDPSLLIPGTAIVKGGKVVTTVAKTAVASAAIGAATGFGQGTVIDHTQLTGEGHAARDYAAFGAIGGALFGGWVGSRAAKAMTEQAKRDAIDALLQTQNASPTLHTTGNAGSMKVNPNIIPDGEKLPVIEGAVKLREGTGIFATPNLQLATSESNVVRRIAQDLGNNALYTEKNLHGVATPQSFELNMRQLSTVLEGQLSSATVDAFKSFKTGFAKADFSAMADELRLAGRDITAAELAKTKPTKEMFHELVAVANRNGDQSAIHEVELAAKATRKIYQELGDTANNQNLFLNLHKQAEREAYQKALTDAPAARTLAASIEDHVNKVIEKQAAQLVRLKDRLFELKSAGKEATPAGVRVSDAITKTEDNLTKKGADNVVKQVHQEFGDRLKAATSNLSDVSIRKQISQALLNEKRLLASDAALTKKAAKENLEKYAQQQAKVARAASEALQPSTATSYLPRMWDIEKVMANEQEFKQVIMSHYMQKGLDPDETTLLVDDLFENMKNTQQGVNKGHPELASTSFGSLNARAIDVPDNLVSKFLINDHEYLTKQYIQDMSRAIEFDNAFGGRSMKEVLGDVAEDYRQMRRDVYVKGLPADKQAKAIEKLNAAERNDQANLTHLYNTLMGQGKDIDFISAGTSTTIKQLVNITSLGQIVAASLSDVGRVVSVNGFMKPLKAAFGMFDDTFRKLTLEEAEQFGYGFERLLSTRANQLIDVESNIMKLRPNMFQRGVNAISSKFHELTLFNRWNSSMKHLAGMIHADKVMKASLDYDALDSGAKAYLAQAGIDKDMAERIAAQFQAHGVEEKSFKFGNTALWDDEVAKQTYQRAVFKLTNHTIMTPDAGTVPKVFKSNIGSIVTQFLSFTAATEEQMLAAGMQRHTVNEVKGLVTMFAAGMAGVMLKDLISGKEDREPEDIIWRGIDATGVFGVAGDINKRLHQGGLGIEDFLSDEEARKIDAMRTAGALAGPGISKGLQTATALINIANGSGGARERSDLWKAVPGNNIWAVKFLAERYGEEINSSFDE